MNQPIIFDTSVWIELIQRKNTEKALLLREYILGNKPIWLTPTIVQEVLQGSRNNQEFERLKNSLLGYRCLMINSVDAAIKAAQLYSSLRQKGVTIRKPNDCLIAIYALHFDIEICHNDIDFNLIAQNSSLKITII
ncbi:MAG: PIN domain-containing protein [Arcicella sp.]|nr:PIN domain-containing protein [Arcicella sp.]